MYKSKIKIKECKEQRSRDLFPGDLMRAQRVPCPQSTQQETVSCMALAKSRSAGHQVPCDGSQDLQPGVEQQAVLISGVILMMSWPSSALACGVHWRSSQCWGDGVFPGSAPDCRLFS